MTSTSALAEFHDELRSVARDLLAPTNPLVTGGEPVAADWATLAGAGWPGLDVPEEHGGAGASFAEVAVVLEELGRAATAAPVLGAVLAAGALQLVEPSPARDELLAGVAAGDVLATVALPTGAASADGPLPFRLDRSGPDLRLAGRAAFVPDAPGTARLLILADDPSSGPVLVAVDLAPGSGVDVRPTPVVDATRSLGEVVADGAPVAAGRCWPLAGGPDPLLARGALAVALDSVGLAQAALDATVAYTSVRQQFGRPIGSFQAVKHACADVAVELAVSRRLVADAVDQVVTGGPDTEDAAVAVAMAKAHATETAVAATGAALQMHGGIGYTWGHGLHVLLKRATLNRSLFGSPATHRARLARRYAAVT